MKRRRILFVSEGAEAAPTRYRARAYFERLREAGWEPSHRTVIGVWRRMALVRAARAADVIVVLRKAFGPTLCGMIKGRDRVLVFDIDDAVFARDDGSVPAETVRRFEGMVAASDAVWAGNGMLAERAGAKALVIPTSVEPALYGGSSTAMADGFDVVWMGSSSTRKYLEGIVPALVEAVRWIPTLRLKIVADFDLPAARAAGVPTVAVTWSAATEGAALRSAHVGIAPLPDDPWTRGKCGLKILQCMAAGLPVVASPVGVQSEIVVAGKTGMLAETEAEWVGALRRLAADAGLRAAMGEAGRARVVEKYSAAVTFEKLLASLRALTGE